MKPGGGDVTGRNEDKVAQVHARMGKRQPIVIQDACVVQKQVKVCRTRRTGRVGTLPAKACFDFQKARQQVMRRKMRLSCQYGIDIMRRWGVGKLCPRFVIVRKRLVKRACPDVGDVWPKTRQAVPKGFGGTALICAESDHDAVTRRLLVLGRGKNGHGLYGVMGSGAAAIGLRPIRRTLRSYRPMADTPRLDAAIVLQTIRRVILACVMDLF